MNTEQPMPNRTFFNARPAPRGVTITELLVVVAIVMLLVGMTIGGMADLSRSHTLRQGVDAAINVISAARNEAISRNAVVHVRINNRGPNDQSIAAYRFLTTRDALSLTSELNIQDTDASTDGWEEAVAAGKAVRVAYQKLPATVFFETAYDPAVLWDNSRHRPKTISAVHTDPATLYYSGYGTANDPTRNPYYAAKDFSGDTLIDNVLPKAPTYQSDGTLAFGTDTHTLLFFYPDGTAGANVMLWIRNDTTLKYLRIWKGGVVETNTIQKRSDFEKLD